jgi:dTDP-4-amino-4,6-dideoxygalactose transaminase
LDPDLLAEELSRCEKSGKMPTAVIPTDIYGQCADYDRISKICKKYDIPVIIDACESLGATYKNRKSGTGTKAGVFSFNGNKIITTSGGGMLVSRDRDFIESARFFSKQARDPAIHYEHSYIGYNYRMSNILAAIGRGQLRVLDNRVARKREIFDFYRKTLGDLPGIELMPEPPYGKSNRWLTVILIDAKKFGAGRETIRLALQKQNIESRPLWKPMHLQPVFKITRKSNGGAKVRPAKPLPGNKSHARAVGGRVAEDLFANGLCLPSGTALKERDLKHIVKIITGCRITVR